MDQSIHEKLARTRKAMSRCEEDQPIDFSHMQCVETASSIIDDAAALASEVISIYEDVKRHQPTGHLWPDPNHVYHAKNLLERIRIGGGHNRKGE